MNRRRPLIAAVAGATAIVLVAACSSSKERRRGGSNPPASRRTVIGRLVVIGRSCHPTRVTTKGGTVNVLVQANFEDLDPVQNYVTNDGDVGRLIYRTLTFIKDTPGQDAGDQARPCDGPGHADRWRQDVDVPHQEGPEVRGRYADHGTRTSSTTSSGRSPGHVPRRRDLHGRHAGELQQLRRPVQGPEQGPDLGPGSGERPLHDHIPLRGPAAGRRLDDVAVLHGSGAEGQGHEAGLRLRAGLVRSVQDQQLHARQATHAGAQPNWDASRTRTAPRCPTSSCSRWASLRRRSASG